MRPLLLYTTLGCHLCEQAEAMLLPVLVHVNRLRNDAGLGPLVLRKVEIADDPVLAQQYGLRIPVVQVHEDARDMGWPFDQGELFAFIASAQI